MTNTENTIGFSQDCAKYTTGQLKECFRFKDEYKEELYTGDEVVKKVKTCLENIKKALTGEKKSRFIEIVTGVGSGRAAEVPYLTIFDKKFDYGDLKTGSRYSAQIGIYIHLYAVVSAGKAFMALTQGHSFMEEQFGRKRTERIVERNKEDIHKLLDKSIAKSAYSRYIKNDGHIMPPPVSDRFRRDAIYAAEWDLCDDKKNAEILNLLVDCYVSNYEEIDEIWRDNFNAGL